MKLLENKTALVTGASRGIGKAIALRLADHGANIAFTYKASEELAKKLESELSNSGVQAKAYKSDAASFQESEELVNSVIEDLGGSIDILVNNAGITRDNLLLRMSEEEWDVVMQVNLKSIFNLTRHISRTMLKQRSGSIINITSVVGIGGNAGQSNYAASKAGIIGFTKSVAKELGSRSIRCNAIAPGFIETEMTEAIDENMKKEFLKGIPMGRYGSSDEVADTVVFLASDMSSYITGQVLPVCGGLST